MESQPRPKSKSDEPVRIDLDELLMDMQEVLAGIPRKLEPRKNERLAELPTSGIYDMRAMATAYEMERGIEHAADVTVPGISQEMVLRGADEERDWSALVYAYAAALGVLFIALSAVLTTLLVRAG